MKRSLGKHTRYPNAINMPFNLLSSLLGSKSKYVLIVTPDSIVIGIHEVTKRLRINFVSFYLSQSNDFAKFTLSLNQTDGRFRHFHLHEFPQYLIYTEMTHC